MKKAFLLIVACTFAFLSTNAQSSQVETVSQTTKTEQFKTNCSFLKESIIGEFKEGGVRILTIVYTDLKTGNELVGMEFESYSTLLNGIKTPENLGYLDFEQIDDLLFALEKILEESKSNDKKDKCAIHYTTASGIDVHYYSLRGLPFVGFRKKWLAKNEFGVPYYTYTAAPPTMGIGKLSDLITEIKESLLIAKKYQNK